MNQLLADFGLTSLTEEERDYLTGLAADTVFNRLILRLAEILSEEDMLVVYEFLNGVNPALEQLARFLATHQISLDQLLGEEIADYRQEIISVRGLLGGDGNG